MKRCFDSGLLRFVCLCSFLVVLKANPAYATEDDAPLLEDPFVLVTQEERDAVRGLIRSPLSRQVTTVDDIVFAAIFHDPHIRVGQYELERMTASSVVMQRWGNPQLRMGYDYSVRSTDAPRSQDIDSADIALRFFPPHIWSRGAEKQSERSRIEAKTALLREKAYVVERNVRLQLLEVIYIERVLRVQKRIIRERVSQLEHFTALQEAGEYSPVDLLREKTRLLAAKNEKDSLQSNLVQARMAVLHLLGLEDDAAWPLGELSFRDIIALPAVPDADNLLELALDQHPALVAARREKEAAAYDLRAVQRRVIPFIDFFQVGYSQRDLDLGRDEESWTLQAAVELPIQAFRSKDSRHVAVLALQREQARVDAARKRVFDKVVTYLATYKTARSMRDTLRSRFAGVVRDIQQLIAEKEATYGEQHPDIRDLRIQLAALFLQQYEAEYQLFRSAVQLKYAVGHAL